MSLKKKDITPSTSTISSGGLRVATDEPHLVSLGGGRLSTAVTIHNLPIGELLIGSSPSCGVILNGSGVLPHHCTLYRSEMNEVTLVPEPEGRTLVDGTKIIDETTLSQGAMLTIGKSNYLRFNNPAEAQLIKSTMGSNERISMPQIDFTQNSFSSNDSGSPEEVFQNLNDYLQFESQNYTNQSPTMINNKQFPQMINGGGVGYPPPSNLNNHSPKVFTADSITVNTPAKDVLGTKYNNFAKNLSQNHVNFTHNSINNVKSSPPSNSPSNSSLNVLTKINNNLNTNSHHHYNGSASNIHNSNCNSNNNCNGKLQPFSACYDRYPKPGSYGTLQVFPLNGINLNGCSESDTESIKLIEEQHKQAQFERLKEEELQRLEQERLEEIIKMCSEYEKQNSSKVLHSPLVQNRIKTNGSLPRENSKKNFIDLNSPSSSVSSSNSSTQNVFTFDEARINQASNRVASGYENVAFIQDYNRDKGRIEIIPQSPRNKIKTIAQSPPQSTNGSFEDRLRQEIKNLRENKINYESLEPLVEDCDLMKLKRNRDITLNHIRELKKQISELQCQEDEVFREFDLEKVLVSAELQIEIKQLNEMEANLKVLKTKIQSLEAQRNANRVMQETQQARLKQNISIRENQMVGLEELIKTNNDSTASIRDEMNSTIELLENDRKHFEDLEFQYLEEETEWLAQREELNKELKILLSSIEVKTNEIKSLEKSELLNHKCATNDTKLLEDNLFILLKELEKCRENLRKIDKKIFNLTGDIDDEVLVNDPQYEFNKITNKIIYGSNEVLSMNNHKNTAISNIMSKSVNENLIFSNNNIEMVQTSTPFKKSLSNDSLNSKSTTSSSSSGRAPVLFQRENSAESDPLLKLKYNLNSLNLSLESDDFEVNPLDKRMPSQDDIDRISKIQLDAPITTTQGASYKVKESIKEIERNRQLLLAQQGTHVIEHERQKMSDLKKKSHDEARAQYMQKQFFENGDESYRNKNSGLEVRELKLGYGERNERTSLKEQNNQNNSNQQRHSHPELDSNQQRPLSEISEASYDPLVDKQYMSTNDISRNGSSNRLSNGDTIDDQTDDDSNRNSFASQNDVNSSNRVTSGGAGARVVSGRRSNVPKSQRPLTRYLPIMSSHLDLRQHVEKAGHQTTLCPHVIVDEFCCRGYLHKLGATFHGWSRRWFVFDRQKRALIYYSDKSERKPRGGAYFTTIDDVYLDHLNTSKSGRPHCTFIVKTKKRSYHLQAASDAAARIWIDVIITGAQGNIDY